MTLRVRGSEYRILDGWVKLRLTGESAFGVGLGLAEAVGVGEGDAPGDKLFIA